MQIYQGKCISDGIVTGRIAAYRAARKIRATKATDADAELERYRQAKQLAAEQLRELSRKASAEVGQSEAAIFEMHQLMLGDRAYNQSVEELVRNAGASAEYAVAATGDRLAQTFAALNDEMMQARAEDVQDISKRLITNLQQEALDSAGSGEMPLGTGQTAGAVERVEKVILAAEELTPSETMQLDRNHIHALILRRGSLYSHSAILARAMGIPAILAEELPAVEELDGKTAAMDAGKGILYVEPDEETLAGLALLKEEQAAYREAAAGMRGLETVSADGRRIRLYANLGSCGELEAVLQNDAEGIGLFRSEFVYLGRQSFPSEEEQFQIYRTVAEAMAGREVIIRTLDIGADKQCAYFDLPAEENPAMGCRAVRICLKRPEIFKVQLRALLRAGAFGRLDIMYPMITSVDEVRRIRELVEDTKRELEEEGIPYGDPRQGIMIETPAAVMISRELAEEVDFFSIGTNDLTQYTLAIDRQNRGLDEFYDPHHPAILRMIRMTVENAHAAGIPVGICGELAADRTLTTEFLSLGVDELSVSPEHILPLRKLIRESGR